MINVLELLEKKLSKNEVYKIVFLGDSITSTEWIHPNWRDILEYVLKYELSDKYPASSWNIRCINLGLDGGSSRDFLNYLPETLDYKPDHVICMGTSNDVHLKIPVEEYLKNFNKITEMLSSNVESYSLSPDIPSLDIREPKYSDYVEAFYKIEVKNNGMMVDVYKEYKQYDLKSFFTILLDEEERSDSEKEELDLIHPNILGNAYIAKILLKNIFNIEFNPDAYMGSLKNNDKYPKY